MKFLILYILFITCTGLSTAGQDVDVSKYSLLGIKDGLTHNQVSEVLQDNFGFIWVATKKGLNRYDGKTVLQFYADSNRNSLPEDEVHRMRMLPNNQLAGLTSSGLFLINTKTLESKTIIIPADSLRYDYKVNGIMDIEGDEEGNVYLLTRSGFYAVDINNKLWYRYDYYTTVEAQRKSFAYGQSIMKLNEESYLLSTAAGTLIFNKKERLLGPPGKEYSKFLQNLLSSKPIFRALYKGDDGFITLNNNFPYMEYYDVKKQISYSIPVTKEEVEKIDWRSEAARISDTLFVLSGEEKGFYFISFNTKSQSFYFNPELHFEKFSCRAFLMDNNKRFWVGTSKGLFKQKNQTRHIEILQLPSTLYPDSTNANFHVVNIIDDKVYAGSMNGLFIFDRNTGKALKRFDFKSLSAESKNIICLEVVNKDSLLIGPNGRMIVFNPQNYSYTEANLPGWEKTYWIPAIHTDNEGTLFISTNEDKLYIKKRGKQFMAPKNLERDPMYNLVISGSQVTDSRNNTWFIGHGMSRYNPQKEAFDIRMDSFPKIKIARREVLSLVLDKAENMYFSVAENGLIIFYPATKKFEQLTRSNGLPDNNIDALYLLEDILWIGTSSGIANYNILTKQVTSFGNLAPDNPSLSFTGLSFYYDSINKYLYAPCNNSIVRFDPINFKNNDATPSFFIENIRINNREIIQHPGSAITLDAGKKSLVISLASINFDDAFNEQLYYRFKSKGSWELLGNQRNFIISNLAEGHHDLQFMLSSKTNSWESKIIDLSIYIKPPFYKSAWFIILASLFFITAIWLLYKRRIESVRQKANIDKQLAELEMKSLHAQMNPHFIFNALNSIKEMIWENDKQNASRYLSKFAQLIRTTLEQSQQTFITVKQCIVHLEQYLEMEKIRFEDFSYSIETDKHLEWDHIRMAPMLVQPLVENAIWHGLKKSSKDKHLEIKFFLEDNHVVCEIADNGPGIHHNEKPEKMTHKSMSISNIHNRLQVLNEKYNMNCSLEIIDKADITAGKHGTIAILRLSL